MIACHSAYPDLTWSQSRKRNGGIDVQSYQGNSACVKGGLQDKDKKTGSQPVTGSKYCIHQLDVYLLAARRTLRGRRQSEQRHRSYYCANRILVLTVCVCVCVVIQSHKPISMTTDYAKNKCVCAWVCVPVTALSHLWTWHHISISLRRRAARPDSS